MKASYCTILLLLVYLFYLDARGQDLKTIMQLPDLDKIGRRCDSLRSAGKFKAAADLYFQTGNKLKSSELFVYAGWQYGMADNPDSALISINQAINNGMMNPNVLSVYNLDKAGTNTVLRKQVDQRLDSIKQSISKVADFKIDTEPFDTFWPYFHAAVSDSAHAAEYLTTYIINGSPAIKDYYHKRYESIDKMVQRMIFNSPQHYLHTQSFWNLKRTSTLKSRMVRMMHNLSKIYPGAVYPKVYIIPGMVESGGTQTELGLFAAAEMFVKDDSITNAGLNKWQRDIISKPDDMIYTSVHELMHFQQSYNDAKHKETLLGKVIIEGVCDFMVELLSDNKTLSHNRIQKINYINNPKNRAFIFYEFKKDMYATNLSKWMYNGGAIMDRPDDLGYAVGYIICKSYYQRSKNKKAAVFELLNTDDFEKILKGSEFAYLLL